MEMVIQPPASHNDPPKEPQPEPAPIPTPLPTVEPVSEPQPTSTDTSQVFTMDSPTLPTEAVQLDTVAAPPPSTQVPDWSPSIVSSKLPGSNKAGLFSLIAGVLAVAIIPLLIFIPKLVSSETMVYTWTTGVAVLGIAGLGFGRKSMDNKGSADFKSLVGIILSLLMVVTCLLVAAYYIKLRMYLSSYENDYSSYQQTIE